MISTKISCDFPNNDFGSLRDRKKEDRGIEAVTVREIYEQVHEIMVITT